MESCTVQLFAQGQWHDVASVMLREPAARGWQARTYTGYGAEWALEHPQARDAWALACDFPVALQPRTLAHWPVFLIDMLPQGFGRAELLRRLALPATLEEAGDWRVLMAGAGNPIGHLRVKEAAAALAADADGRDVGPGFSDLEVAERAEDFTEYLAAHGLFVAGSSGVQGAWPKLLLTRARDGLLHLDHALPDDEAVQPYIVKFGRGADPRLASILRHEAPYMALARRLGLRVHADLIAHDRVLFIPRFDRVLREGRWVRLAQESLASLMGVSGFGALPCHEDICARLARTCTDPAAEVLEYLRRDVANIALGNKDNHARNTALQRDFDGRIALTPLFDFAPMVLHPDGIARRIRWRTHDGGMPDWSRIVDAAATASGVARDELARGLQAMAPTLAAVADDGAAHGLEPELHRLLLAGLRHTAAALAALH